MVVVVDDERVGYVNELKTSLTHWVDPGVHRVGLLLSNGKEFYCDDVEFVDAEVVHFSVYAERWRLRGPAKPSQLNISRRRLSP